MAHRGARRIGNKTSGSTTRGRSLIREVKQDPIRAARLPCRVKFSDSIAAPLYTQFRATKSRAALAGCSVVCSMCSVACWYAARVLPFAFLFFVGCCTSPQCLPQIVTPIEAPQRLTPALVPRCAAEEKADGCWEARWTPLWPPTLIDPLSPNRSILTRITATQNNHLASLNSAGTCDKEPVYSRRDGLST